MPQCEKYPDRCNGLVQFDDVDGKWYCERHFSEYDHLEVTERKTKTRDKAVILKEREERIRLRKEGKPIPPRADRVPKPDTPTGRPEDEGEG